MTHPSGYSNWVSPQTLKSNVDACCIAQGQILVLIKGFQESQYFFARKEVPIKRKTPSYWRCWSIVSFSAVKNVRHAHICLLKAIYLHPSKPLISLVFITCTTYYFQGQGHCYVTIPIVFPANHKPCLDQVQVGPLWGNIVPTNILVTFIGVPPWSLVSPVHSNGFCLHGATDDRTITFSRLVNRSKFPGRLFEGGRL